MKQWIQLIIFITFIPLSLHAQDVHYSQFYTDYLRLNPSMAGNFDGSYRIGLNLRNQYSNVPAPYQTLSAYGDASLMKDHSRPNWLGAGLRVLYDRAGDGRLSTAEIQGALSFHQRFNDQLYASLGLGGTFVQKRIEYDRLFFSDQWNGQDFDEANSSGESNQFDPTSYMDLQAGFTINYFNERSSLQLGSSILHLNRPVESFFGLENQRGMRLVVHASGTTWLGGGNFGLQPAAYYTSEKKASELVLGTNLMFQLGESYNEAPTILYIGSWYRLNDAFAVLAGIEFMSIRLLASYDFTISKPYSAFTGGPEISITHVGLFGGRSKGLDCPRF